MIQGLSFLNSPTIFSPGKWSFPDFVSDTKGIISGVAQMGLQCGKKRENTFLYLLVFLNTNKFCFFLHIFKRLGVLKNLLVFRNTNKSLEKELIISIVYRYKCINKVLICIYFCILWIIRVFCKYRVKKTSKSFCFCMWLKMLTKNQNLFVFFTYKKGTNKYKKVLYATRRLKI